MGLAIDQCQARIRSNTAFHLAVRTLQVPVPAVPVAVTSTGTKALSTHEGGGQGPVIGLSRQSRSKVPDHWPALLAWTNFSAQALART
jgi:hypothetical protein